MDPLEIAAWAALVKASRPLAQPLVDVAADLLSKLLGAPAKASGKKLAEMIAPPAPAQPTVADGIARWKSANLVEVLATAAQLLDAEGLAASELPRDFLLPLLEAAAYAQDDELRAAWAQLVVSATKSAEHRHPIIAVVLRQLSAEDLALFRTACETADRHGVEFGAAAEAPVFAQDLGSDTEARLVALDLVEPWTADTLETRAHRGAFMPDDSRPYGLGMMPTRFGAAFRRAVMPRAAVKSSRKKARRPRDGGRRRRGR
jgi:hypothetical protein